jgi:dTDP-4-dehydrorhamnose reductase
MLKLATQKELLKVVNDQYGCPTSSDWLARVALQLAVSDAESGLYHSVVDGQTTWYGLASFAIETARNAGMPVQVKSDYILPIPSEDYPLPAPRPKNSVMDNAKLKTTLKKIGANSLDHPWQEQVQQYVIEYVQKLSQ